MDTNYFLNGRIMTFQLKQMIQFCWCLISLVFFLNVHNALGQSQAYRGHPTDTLTSAGDNTRSGYLPNHNIDPNVLKSGSFGVIWSKKMLGNYKGFIEQFYAQPLVYTPQGSNSTQNVYVVSQQNIAYILDGKTGDILIYRQLHIPFQVVPDLEGCQDISDTVGSSGTGVIDPATGTWYLLTKSYEDQTNQNPQGLKKGRYYIHALDTITLAERPGFPVSLDGLTADNAPWRMFEGGKHHQRPALIQINQYVYAGFASHCVQWNFTGWLIGWHAQTGQIVTKFAMEGGKEQSGIGGGIWMSGGGISSDNSGRMFFATGNGYANQLVDDPVPGRSPPTALEEAVVNMAIKEDGSVQPVDFFIPWEKRDLDAMDKDLGTSGFVLLDPSTFSTNSVKKIGCVTGKMGKLYFMNVEDLGGYQMGPNRKDRVLQGIQLEAPVFSTAGSYPLEGGYVYISPVGKQTVVFKFGSTADGRPVFTEAGRTSHSSAGRQGVGHGTVTSLNGQPGTGVLWVVDVEGINVRAYNAVPVNGVLEPLLLMDNPGQSKFSRPSFGDGRVYLTTTTGYVTALGSPVNMPFACSSPFDAGTTIIGNQNITQVKCTAKIPLTVTILDLSVPTHFSLSGIPTLPLQILQGNDFIFSVIFKPASIGPLSTTINIRTVNGGTLPYALNTPVVIRGVARSVKPILIIQPNVLSFGEVITGSDTTVALNFAIQNGGESELIVQSFKWSTVHPNGPYISSPTPGSNGDYTIGPFKIIGLPSVGSSILGNNRSITTVNFRPMEDGYYKLYLVIQTNGGTTNVGAFGTGGSAPVAYLEWELSTGKWIPYNPETPWVFDGGVNLGSQQTRRLRLTNKGGTTLTTMVSKPPVIGFLAALNGLGSIAEGSQLAPNQSEYATLICSPPKSQVNKDASSLSAVWTLNFNDPKFGKQKLQFTCDGLSMQVGPLKSDGQARYRYIGCFKDADPDRQLPDLLYYSDKNDNGMCIGGCQIKANYIFAATEYEGECWCGNILPKRKFPDTNCQYLCKGNYTQYCGGDGAYMSLFADSERFNTNLSVISPTSSSPSIISTASATVTLSLTTTFNTKTTTVLTATTSTPTRRPQYQSLGCVNEGTSGRALTKDGYASNAMTPEACQDYCTGKGYRLSGTEYSTECYCGNILENASIIGGSTACTMPCAGDPTLICGGPSALTVFNNTALVITREPATLAGFEEYLSQGCFTEGINGRALVDDSTAASNMTVPFCIRYCKSLGYKFAGLEYSTECYCGKQVSNNAAQSALGCDMLCGGDTYTFCGGSGRLNIYSAPFTISSITPTTSTVASASFTTLPSSVLSSSRITTSSTTASITTTFTTLPSSVPSSRITTSSTTAPITTTFTTLPSSVPSSSRIPTSSTTAPITTTFTTLPSSMLSSSRITTSSTTAPITTTFTSPKPTQTSTLSSTSVITTNPWVYLGCANETDPRALNGLSLAGSMTIQKCQSFCLENSFPLVGLEYGDECYCGTTLNLNSKLSQTGCDMPCTGNSNTICGGVSRLSIYNHTLYTPAVVVSSVGAFKVLGCFKEGSSERALGGFSFMNDTLTVEQCVGSCKDKGFGYAGVEYGSECYCGDAIGTQSQKVEDIECNMSCSGNKRTYCGAGNRLIIYWRNGTIVA